MLVLTSTALAHVSLYTFGAIRGHQMTESHLAIMKFSYNVSLFCYSSTLNTVLLPLKGQTHTLIWSNCLIIGAFSFQQFCMDKIVTCSNSNPLLYRLPRFLHFPTVSWCFLFSTLFFVPHQSTAKSLTWLVFSITFSGPFMNCIYLSEARVYTICRQV